MAIDNEKWAIQGEPDTAIPEVGAVYEVRDRRKGTYTGRILKVNGCFAEVERIAGKIRWMSTENNLLVGSEPDVVSARVGLVTLVRK